MKDFHCENKGANRMLWVQTKDFIWPFLSILLTKNKIFMILLFRHKLVKMFFLNEFPSKKLPLEENEVLIMFSVILETIPHCTSVVKRRNYPNVLIVGFFLFSSETSFIGQTYHGSKYFYFMTLDSTKIQKKIFILAIETSFVFSASKRSPSSNAFDLHTSV